MTKTQYAIVTCNLSNSLLQYQVPMDSDVYCEGDVAFIPAPRYTGSANPFRLSNVKIIMLMLFMVNIVTVFGAGVLQDQGLVKIS